MPNHFFRNGEQSQSTTYLSKSLGKTINNGVKSHITKQFLLQTINSIENILLWVNSCSANVHNYLCTFKIPKKKILVRILDAYTHHTFKHLQNITSSRTVTTYFQNRDGLSCQVTPLLPWMVIHFISRRCTSNTTKIHE